MKTPRIKAETDCEVYWGSHGCHRERGHKGGHFCCCECAGLHPWGDEEAPDVLCVGKFPYYGPKTRFYGGDARRANWRFLLLRLMGAVPDPKDMP